MSNQQGEFYVALENLRTAIEAKIEKVDERQRDDIKQLEVKNDKWQDEVRDEFTAVKTRLKTIETKIAAKKKEKEKNLKKFTGWISLFISACIAVITYFRH